MIIELKPEKSLVALRGATLDAVAGPDSQEAVRLKGLLQSALRARLEGVLARYNQPIISSGLDMVWRVDIRQPNIRTIGEIQRNTA